MVSTTQQAVKSERPAKAIRHARPAGFFSRAQAFVIDLIILMVAELFASAFIQMVLGFFRFTGLSNALKTFFNNTTVGGIAVTLFVVGYFVLSWTLLGFTPGKAILGLRVTRKGETRISFWRALVRFFAYWVSAIPLFLGFFWIIWDSNRQGWHDKIAGTKVLYTPKKPKKVG